MGLSSPQAWLASIEHVFDTSGMAKKGDLHTSALHGTAMKLTTEMGSMADAVAELRALADGRNDLLAETAGLTAGSWAAQPAGRTGLDLMAAALLIWAGNPLDYDELARWVAVGMERGAAAARPIHGSS
jgi:hypothetical protein